MNWSLHIGGTEFQGDKLRDLLTADGQMVLLKVNQQLDGARKAVEIALELAKQRDTSVTVTGHSLGGALAQITAAEYGLRGETFNAYGAAGLHNTIAGGTQVVNHVRATDMVSAAGKHFGSIRAYATEKDTALLLNDGSPPSQQSRVEFLKDVLELGPGNTHSMVQFYGGPRGEQDGAIYGRNSIVNAESVALYEQNRSQFDAYRDDIRQAAVAARLGMPAAAATPLGKFVYAHLGFSYAANKLSDAFGHDEEMHQLRLQEQRVIDAKNADFKLPERPLIFRDGARSDKEPSVDALERLKRDLRQYETSETTPGESMPTRLPRTRGPGADKLSMEGAVGLNEAPRPSVNTRVQGSSDPFLQAIWSQLPPGTSREKAEEVKLAAKIGGIEQPDQLKTIHTVPGDTNAYVEGRFPGFRAKVDLSAAAPSLENTLARERTHDQEQALALERFEQQQARMNQDGPRLAMGGLRMRGPGGNPGIDTGGGNDGGGAGGGGGEG